MQGKRTLRAYRSYSFSDINGDGLDDLIMAKRSSAGATQCNAAWVYQLNLGGTFAPVVQFAGANQAGIEEDFTESNCQSVARDWDAQQASLTSFEDFNADGRAEIVIPRGFDTHLCTIVDVTLPPKNVLHS